VVSDEPPPIATANPYAPVDLAAVIDQCLAKDPVKRFASAADLDHALAACPCAGLWDDQRSTDWWEKHPYTSPGDGTGTDLNSLPIKLAKTG
jgi:hypothetical protein